MYNRNGKTGCVRWQDVSWLVSMEAWEALVYGVQHKEEITYQVNACRKWYRNCEYVNDEASVLVGACSKWDKAHQRSKRRLREPVRIAYRSANRWDLPRDTHTGSTSSWECSEQALRRVTMHSRTLQGQFSQYHSHAVLQVWYYSTVNPDSAQDCSQFDEKKQFSKLYEPTDRTTEAYISVQCTVCTHDSPLKGVGPRTNGGEIMTRCLGIRTLKEHRRFLILRGTWPTTGFECCNPFLPSPPLSLDNSDTSNWHNFLAGGGASSPDIWRREGDALPVDW